MRTAVFDEGTDHFEDFEEYLDYFHYKFRALETVRKLLHGIMMNTFTGELIKVKIDFKRRVVIWNGIPNDKNVLEIDWDEDPKERQKKDKYKSADEMNKADIDQSSLDSFSKKN